MSHPRIVQWNWKRTIPQFLIMFMLIVAYYWLLPRESRPDAVVYAAITYLVYSILSRQIIPRYHRKGIRMMAREHYPEAIVLFGKSVEFFENYPWLDKYRSIFLLSASSFAYREMGLMNIAYAFSQMNEGAKAEGYYSKVLNSYPDNKVAQSALNLIMAGRNTTKNSVEQ